MKHFITGKSAKTLLTLMLLTGLSACKPGQYSVDVEVEQDFAIKNNGKILNLKRGDRPSATLSEGFAGLTLTLAGQNLSLVSYRDTGTIDLSNVIDGGAAVLKTERTTQPLASSSSRESCYHSYYGCGFDVTDGQYSCGFKNEWGTREIIVQNSEQLVTYSGQILQNKTEVAQFSGTVSLGAGPTSTTTGDCHSNVGNF